MRQPKATDVIEAVEYVTGWDPRNHSRAREVIAARRLAVAALREICDLTYKGCARALGYDHTTIIHHARGNVDVRLLKMVLERVNDTLTLESAAREAEVNGARSWTP